MGQVLVPGGFVPAQAMSFSQANGDSVAVGIKAPPPVDLCGGVARSVAIEGTLNASGAVGPFVAKQDHAIWLVPSDSWSQRPASAIDRWGRDPDRAIGAR